MQGFRFILLYYLLFLAVHIMPFTIRSNEHNLRPRDLNELHFKLMNQQCPVHFKTPYVEINQDGDIQYSCCCEKLKNLCLLVIKANQENSE